MLGKKRACLGCRQVFFRIGRNENQLVFPAQSLGQGLNEHAYAALEAERAFQTECDFHQIFQAFRRRWHGGVIFGG